jgi:NADH-quinone oxidoreductase subunit H
MVKSMLKLLFNYLVFPGFLFTAIIGLLAGWVDRKITARIQWRVGPPWYQNFVDLLKLLGKEVIVPRINKGTFLISPLLALISVTLVATILGMIVISPDVGFLGDLIVVLYLLAIPGIAVILGASSSGNPLASIGASREVKLLLSYELPFILACVVTIIKSGGSLRLEEILSTQLKAGAFLSSFSGAIAFCVAIICIQAKLGFVPFDIAEAEQEIMAGALIEYSGAGLAMFKLSKQMLLVVLPVFLIILFWAGDLSIFSIAWKYIALLVVIILLKNTNPRFRIDQAIKLFWGPITLLAIIAVGLALLGK